MSWHLFKIGKIQDGLYTLYSWFVPITIENYCYNNNPANNFELIDTRSLYNE